MSTLETLRELQAVIGQNNEAKGFHDDIPDRVDFVAGERGDQAFESATRQYHGNLLMLIVSEATEAHDEIRSGRDAWETYYPTLASEMKQGVEHERHKPEGVPSEIADIIIRCFDYGYRHSIDIPAMILEKIAYNTTRPYKHGKKF